MNRAQYRLLDKMCWQISLLIFTLIYCAACGEEGESRSSRLDNLFGKDDRIEITEKSHPWSPIGRLDSGCTATLIGKRLLLTAAHCAIDNKSGRVKANLGYFRPNYGPKQKNEALWIERVWFGSHNPEDKRLKDWAFLLLERSPSEDYGSMWLSEERVIEHLPQLVNLAGYSSDRNQGETLTAHVQCTMRKVGEEGRIFHDCDGAAGFSGGALFRSGQRGSEIVALSVSEYRQGASQSVHRDEYSDEYANVAIPVNELSPIAQKLRATADQGGIAPEMEGVFVADNTNLPPQNRIDLAQLKAKGAAFEKVTAVLIQSLYPLAMVQGDESPIYLEYSRLVWTLLGSARKLNTIAHQLISEGDESKALGEITYLMELMSGGGHSFLSYIDQNREALIKYDSSLYTKRHLVEVRFEALKKTLYIDR